MKQLGFRLLFSLYAVLTTRIVLNIRQANSLGQDTELHTVNGYNEALAFATPLQVIRSDRHQDSTVQGYND
jgi:hypothetical protein